MMTKLVSPDLRSQHRRLAVPCAHSAAVYKDVWNISRILVILSSQEDPGRPTFYILCPLRRQFWTRRHTKHHPLTFTTQLQLIGALESPVPQPSGQRPHHVASQGRRNPSCCRCLMMRRFWTRRQGHKQVALFWRSRCLEWMVPSCTEWQRRWGKTFTAWAKNSADLVYCILPSVNRSCSHLWMVWKYTEEEKGKGNI